MLSAFLVFFFCAVAVSFVCSVTESGLLSLNRADIARLTESGSSSGAALGSMKSNVDKPLAAVLTLNTVANTVGAAGVGSEAEQLWGDRGMAMASAILTVTILVLGEIIPKSIGSRYAFRLADPLVWALRAMLFLTYPVVIVLQQLSRLLGGSTDRKTTREDITLYAKIGHADGTLEDDEARQVERLMQLPKVTMNEIMTPWHEVKTFFHDTTLAQLLDESDGMPFARLPVCHRQTQEIVGMIRERDVYQHLHEGDVDVPLQQISRPIRRARSSAPIHTAFGQKTLSETLILVEDAEGKPTGIATLEDALEFVFSVEIESEEEQTQ